MTGEQQPNQTHCLVIIIVNTGQKRLSVIVVTIQPAAVTRHHCDGDSPFTEHKERRTLKQFKTRRQGFYIQLVSPLQLRQQQQNSSIIINHQQQTATRLIETDRKRSRTAPKETQHYTTDDLTPQLSSVASKSSTYLF